MIVIKPDIFEQVPSDIWLERSNWIDSLHFEKEEGWGEYLLSDQATALLFDMRLAFCAGAWISVVILAISTIDAQLRETEAMDEEIRTYQLLNEFYEGEDINWLRKVRNKYVHIDIRNPSLKMDDWYDSQEQMEKDARRAMEITVNAFYQNPGV